MNNYVAILANDFVDGISYCSELFKIGSLASNSKVITITDYAGQIYKVVVFTNEEICSGYHLSYEFVAVFESPRYVSPLKNLQSRARHHGKIVMPYPNTTTSVPVVNDQSENVND